MRSAMIVRKSSILDWEQIPALPIDHLHWCDPVDITAQARICYDENALYVLLSAREASIRAEETGPVGSPCLDSCLEFFLSPDPADSRYINIEYNPNACLYLGIGHNRYDLIRMLPEDKDLLSPWTERTLDGWTVSYRIPFAFLRSFFPGFTGASGSCMRANFYKCGDLTPQLHYLSWNAMTTDNPDFHRSCDFGELHFE